MPLDIIEDQFFFRYLYEGSMVETIMAETFLQLHGLQVYSIRSPMESMFNPGCRILFVANKDYLDAIETLVFLGYMHGYVDELGYLNAASVLLGRDVSELLPADRQAVIRESIEHLRVHEVIQLILFVITFPIMAVASIFGFFGWVMVALVGIILFYKSEMRQMEIRDLARSYALPPAEVVIELAGRGMCQYAVFLRSFGVLRSWLTSRDVHRNLVVDPYESRIVDAVRYGASLPVVALTDPSIEEVPVIGACRFSAQTVTEWEEFVAKILKGAILIVVHITEMSEGLELELKMIRESGLMAQTVFIVGRRAEEGIADIDGFNIAEAKNMGARILSHTVFEPRGLSEFIDAVEDIRNTDTESNLDAVFSPSVPPPAHH